MNCKIALAEQLSNVVVPPEEFIICVGEEAHEMFFLVHGFADVISRGGGWVCTLKKGAFFGEMALLQPNTKRNATIKALNFCDLYKLGREAFEGILDRFPTFRRSITEEVERRRSLGNSQHNNTDTKNQDDEDRFIMNLLGIARPLPRSFSFLRPPSLSNIPPPSVPPSLPPYLPPSLTP